MANNFPSTHYACQCSDLTSAPLPTINKRASIQPATIQLNDDQTFNPHSRRANHALYPLDHLLYCDECDATRCPRCWTEEILYWYCPMCLFEVPSSTIKGDGNRCSRSCYSCPLCTSQLVVTQMSNQRDEGLLRPNDAAGAGETYILQCHYCDWTSLDVDVQFSKPTKITDQLNKLRKTRMSAQEGDKEGPLPEAAMHDTAFANLANFYKEQLNGSEDSQNPYSNSPYSSPANLARIMSLYGGLPYNALKKSREKPQPMREALQRSEGLRTYTATETDATVARMQAMGWDRTTSSEQRFATALNNDARIIDQLWPAAAPLLARRGKRCKTCRQFLARPEGKIVNTKYRIRLLAVNYIPRLSIRPLQQTEPAANSAFHLRADPIAQETLQPYQTRQYILTVRNPVFEPVKISLATPATTPGKVASRVTILCPSFTIGPAGEIWDDALASSAQSSTDGGRKAAMASLTGSSEGSGDRQPEAGKIWDMTRNSTSVVLEIVPGSLVTAPSIVPSTQQSDDFMAEDDDVLQVPIYVRAEWEVEVKPGETVQGRKDADKQPGEKVQKELGYWVVLSVGKIAT